MTLRPIRNMVNHETHELFFDDLEIPEENLLGPEGQGFRTLLDGLNAERALIAAECIGDGYWFIERATRYANEREVFNRKIGQNQGVQFPIAEAFIEIEAANLMRWRACEEIDSRRHGGVGRPVSVTRDCAWGHEPQPGHCEARSAAAVHGALPQASAAWMAAGLKALAMTAQVGRPWRRFMARRAASRHSESAAGLAATPG